MGGPVPVVKGLPGKVGGRLEGAWAGGKGGAPRLGPGGGRAPPAGSMRPGQTTPLRPAHQHCYITLLSSPTHTHTNQHTHTHMHIHKHTHTRIDIHTPTYTHTHTCNAYKFTKPKFTHTSTHTHTQIHSHGYTSTDMHILEF